jgi:uncharacterized protein
MGIYVGAGLQLGQLYSDHKSSPHDDAAAAYWLRLSAEQGNAEAKSELAALYLLGAGVGKDITQYVFWLRKAAEQWRRASELNLANSYFLAGRGQG